MKAELQRYLDGELTFDALSPELQDEARAWEQAVGDVPEDVGGVHAPAWIEEAVMAAVSPPAARRGSGRAGWVGWLTRPREIRVSPLVGGLLAATVAALMVLPRSGAPTGGETTATLYVQFIMEAPSARSVAVAGDFNDWEARHELDDADGDGVWTGRIAVQPGIHEYMFVIDGDEWVTPPGAEGYRDDGFGSRNAVVTVLPSA